jgi:hypothetical protein
MRTVHLVLNGSKNKLETPEGARVDNGRVVDGVRAVGANIKFFRD